ncbi:hypothetical protein NIES2135_54280 [Leptolyngbya boryana NIES-2135]|jgi:hypothetical protein|uniref:Uncharacterized protein n=1 Tax=Leptolyngbya boryana NIES-2135 TaxID=1973484 RepID=A0A1Z4JP60_LEPBY|nr:MULTISPECIES: hypothetical protein [Leptolyngbya]BAY58555.1 hypothetical protein NIES2135_54280 [Leptolyngbya boryana NIES-2135]MBD2370768.1 hypothetical protein [Leptolyngbya sp. FACHB-161]MBD2377079.1 hypothetical protein [Leptolyngbya sp. FACHB-238]MBD2401522.1 hypothetical protein [Leptolyngbya sp. FACHB-239]MBD2408074.1 hypothetical protein [Leptolyngbya sp. FACHB-402]
MTTLTLPKKNETTDEVVICVKTQFGEVHKRTTFAEAWTIKSLVVGVEAKSLPSENGVVEKDAIVYTYWSDLLPKQARRKVRESTRRNRLYDFEVSAHQIVPLQQTEALTRLETVLRRWEFGNYVGTISEMFEEASVAFGLSRTKYHDFAVSERVIAVVKRG